MTIFTDTGSNTQAKRIQRIRDAADSVTTFSVSDASILEKLEKSDVWIQTITQKYDWISTDKEWDSVLEASENRAASKIPGILKDTYDRLVADYNKTIKALTGRDETQSNTLDPISDGINITNELDPAVYTPDQDVFTND